MNHDVIESGDIINIPISVHWFVFTEVIFNDINLNLSKYEIDQQMNLPNDFSSQLFAHTILFNCRTCKECFFH